MDYLRVLVIDDSLTIRAIVEQVVQQYPGCRVVGTASSIADARAMVDDLAPNVITLDLSMPDVDGLTFLRELRGKPHPPIVVVSSSTRGGCETSASALELGADACFDKTKLVSDASRFVRVLKKAASRKLRQATEAPAPAPKRVAKQL
jgi:chemotaxis response regulator CheB